jgi:hypothetical protein
MDPKAPNHACSRQRPRILVTDDYVIKSLEAIEHHERRGSVAVASPFVTHPASRNKLIQTFNHMADLMESELLELV